MQTKKKSLVERLWTKLKLSIETKNTTTNYPECIRNIKTKSHSDCEWLLLLLDMTSQPTNAHKCMKVYNTHCIPPTCFSHSCGHFQGCALKRMDKSKYFNSFILCNTPHCRWRHEWPKHVQGIQHVWCTFIYLCAFAGFATISNCLVHSYGLFKLSPL